MTNNGSKWIYLARYPLESPLTPAWVAATKGLFNFDESSRIIAIRFRKQSVQCQTPDQKTLSTAPLCGRLCTVSLANNTLCSIFHEKKCRPTPQRSTVETARFGLNSTILSQGFMYSSAQVIYRK